MSASTVFSTLGFNALRQPTKPSHVDLTTVKINPALKQTWRHWQNAPVLSALLLAQVVFLAVFCMRVAGWLEPLELKLYDTLLQQQTATQAVDKRITIIWGTDEDQRRWGWPLTDKQLVRLLNTLLSYQPKVVGLDIYRDLPVPMSQSKSYDELMTLFAQHPHLIGIQKLVDEQGDRVDPPRFIENTNQLGINDVIVDQDGVIRRGLLFADDGKTVYFSLAMRLATEYLKQQGIFLDGKGVFQPTQQTLPPLLSHNFGGYQNANMGGYQFLMRYPAAPQAFDSLTVTDVLQGHVDPELLRDRIIIIGTNAEATPDFFYTPVTRSDDFRMAGAALHAYNTAQILQHAYKHAKPVSSLQEWQELTIIWLACLTGAILALVGHSILRFAVLLGGGVLCLLGLAYLGFQDNWWLPMVAPILGFVLAMILVIAYSSYLERQQRTILMDLFSSHVSSDVARVIWQAREQYLNNGRLMPQRLTATVLFTDLQGFTTVSENMEPNALLEWLNDYMDSMVQIVEAHHGQVNKFIGDAVMAIFGVPIPSESAEDVARDATNAVNCALAMRREMERLRQDWRARNLPEIRMRVGIYTGPLVAGSLGSRQRQEYTVLGDTVNTASRLESFDKNLDSQSPCRILIGESTLSLLGNRYETQCVGKVNLKGKRDAITIHRVTGRTLLFTPDPPAAKHLTWI